jgi:hypothetical protein
MKEEKLHIWMWAYKVCFTWEHNMGTLYSLPAERVYWIYPALQKIAISK